MKTLLKKSTKFIFSVVPVVAIVFILNIKKSDETSKPAPHLRSVVNNPFAANTSSSRFADLPCGFVSRGKQEAEKPTFVTNNYIPILQYPSGNFPGTNVQIYNSIYSEHQNDQLILQLDGNLVIYCLTCNPQKAIWSAQTNGKDGKTLFFQPDGDLVLRNTLGKVVWHSNIHSKCDGSNQAYFTLQDDGNLAMLFNETNDSGAFTDYLGGTGSTNDQVKMSHPGKIQ